jgi:hypothetical protein
MGAHVRAMSALAPKSDIDQLTFDVRHKRTSPRVRVMSALPPKATSRSTSVMCQTATLISLFDHLVRA